jgi:hypothetical protein
VLSEEWNTYNLRVEAASGTSRRGRLNDKQYGSRTVGRGQYKKLFHTGGEERHRRMIGGVFEPKKEILVYVVFRQ